MRVPKVTKWLPVVASLGSIIPHVSAALLQPRDICANVNADLGVLGTIYGAIDACICVSGIADFCQTNSIAASAFAIAGEAATYLALDVLITTGTPVSSCPGSSSPSGRKRSPADLARLEHKCDWGLTKCGLPTGLSYAEALAEAGYGSQEPTRTVNENGKKKKNEHIIAPFNYALVEAYECLDVQTNLESCGGCVAPYTLGLSKGEIESLVPGVDCTAQEGVSDVECLRGACVVKKCRKGWELAPAVGAAAEREGLLQCVPKGKSVEVAARVAQGHSGDLHV
ncbi:hypothetical protein DL93DRAFT_2080261 [Clavulina sp. PMI_390]|nr:hypothetical protein DL93DRAFT_2080261 [Clavulina sp. PMI_390]